MIDLYRAGWFVAGAGGSVIAENMSCCILGMRTGIWMAICGLAVAIAAHIALQQLGERY